MPPVASKRARMSAALTLMLFAGWWQVTHRRPFTPRSRKNGLSVATTENPATLIVRAAPDSFFTVKIGPLRTAGILSTNRWRSARGTSYRESQTDRGHESDCIIATNTLGSLYVIKGDLDRAIPQLERSLALARTWSRVGWSTVGFLGQAYAQSGRFDEAFRLFQEVAGASKQAEGEVRSCRFRQLGEIHLLAGHPAEASEHARQALELARDRKQRSFEALALRLLAEAASHRDRFQPAEAEGYYRRALALATELGMRPLVAHCYLGLGKLYRRMGKRYEAQEHFATAITMCREMDMTYWLDRAEAETRFLS